MIIQADTAVSFPVLFQFGEPDGTVDWQLFDFSGLIASGSLTPDPGAVSLNIRINPSNNALQPDTLSAYRDLDWTYETAGQTVNGGIRYTIEARLPLGVTADGVRRKLGVDVTDLPDGDIPLVKAYSIFKAKAGGVDLTDDYLTIDAVEAQAAYDLLPTMIVRVAVSEESGTDKYKRQNVDWAAIAVSLQGYITAGLVGLNPVYDPTIDFGSLLILAPPTADAFTGA